MSTLGEVRGAVGVVLAACAALLGAPAVVAAPLDDIAYTDAGEGQVRAGIGRADTTWHVGASAGQYASTKEEFDPNGEIDPSLLQVKNLPSYGIQSRLDARAIVIEGAGGQRVAIVKNDLYIPQDLLWRRTAQILEAGDSGITRKTLSIAVTHNHSSPYYSSTAPGAWTFQDVVDVRFFEYYARRMAAAVEEAAANLRPARIGAAVGTLDKPHRHSFGPALADDGTPAGYPHSDADHELTVVRIDDVSGAKARPLAILANWSLHPEMLDGNDLISADYVGPLQRMVDRRTGAMLLYTQAAVGTAEPERSTYHDMHERLEFTHREYAQAEFAARIIADEIVDTHSDVLARTPEGAYAPLERSMAVRMADRFYPGPLSHPVPTVSNCRFDYPAVPVAGLPDCQRLPLTTQDAGVSLEMLKPLGVPIPENISVPGYGGLEESFSVHMQALRLGDILLTLCSCEQWADQSRNIRTRTDRLKGNQYLGYQWADHCVPAGAEWSCVNPRKPEERLVISDARYQRMRAQVANDAVGWDFVENVATAESEPADPAQIKGNFTHEELAPEHGYAVTVPVGMANDYNGYIATYREFQRGDHYRKALTAWGPHSADYFATRLVELGGHLKEPGAYVLPTERQRQIADAFGLAKTAADQALNDARAASFGEVGRSGARAYAATLPDDGGAAEPLTQPEPVVERFGAALFEWRGGSNYTDDPRVIVQRRIGQAWVDYADQSGEVPVTLRFPRPGDGVPDYTQGSFQWRWTATFEAFVAGFRLGDRPRATPPGDYRFVVDGRRREGGKEVPYRVVSDVFAVAPWDGIEITGIRAERDGAVSLEIGPRRVVRVPGEPAMEAELGPIDYPDSYEDEGRARFIDDERTAIRDPRAPANPRRVEWYCFACSFRPWLDVGDAASVKVRIRRANGRAKVVPAHRAGGRWRTRARLRRGDSARVVVGGVRDAWRNFNGRPSAVVRRGEGGCRNVVRGTAAGDRLRGTGVADRILGRGGDDHLLGEAGPDCVKGGPGDDVLRGGAGTDRLAGGPGDDRVMARGGRRGSVADLVRCGPGRDVAKVDARDVTRGCERVRRK